MLQSEIFNGSKFENEKVMRILESAYRWKKRIRIFYGENGKLWNDEFDIIGRVGRSTGENKIALLIHNSRSTGGVSILTDCIAGIYDVETKRALYWADGFKMPVASVGPSDIDTYHSALFLDGELYARGDYEKMRRLGDFMTGKRMNK